jgi:DNA ligase D
MRMPERIVVEVPGPGGVVREVGLSNPEKVYFAERGETKLQMIEYFLAVGHGIVRALHERPCTLERHPGGADTHRIFQKRAPTPHPEWVETVRVTFPSGRHADELCVTELGSVIWAASLGTLTFHPWPSRRADTEHPDELRIDLDPQPGTGFSEAVRVAFAVRELLGELGAVGWPKTSGGRGLHVAVRIEPRWGFRTVRRAALALARELERRMPADITTAWWKEERGEAVFVDYNQNARDRTIASAYSIRARPDAVVSAPVTWDELAGCVPEDFTISTMPERFRRVGDRHAGIDDVSWSLEPLLEMAERDERDHDLGEAPYPPSFPKMPGEPKRVQPSRNRDLTSEGGAEA